MVRVLDERWSHVAAYRPLPQPEVEACTIIIEQPCDVAPSVQNVFTLVSASLPGHTIANIDIDYQNGTSGPWNDLYEGDYTCPGLLLDILKFIRALLTTSTGAISQCTIVLDPLAINLPSCGSGGGGGGPFN